MFFHNTLMDKLSHMSRGFATVYDIESFFRMIVICGENRYNTIDILSFFELSHMQQIALIRR